MGVELDDNALMLRYADGDDKAFEELYGRHKGGLYRYLVRQIRNESVAEEVFQEVWSRIIRNRKTYRPTAKFTTFMYHIARNCVIDRARRKGRQPDLVTVDDDPAIEPAADTDDPVEVAETGDIRSILLGALSNLPDKQREVFLLHQEAGMTLQEIAELTEASRETVKSQLRYAMTKLRAALPREAVRAATGI